MLNLLLSMACALAFTASTSAAQTLPRIRSVPQPAAPSPSASFPDSGPMGALPPGLGTVRRPRVIVAEPELVAGPPEAGPLTALQIAQSFLAADRNRDGELTPEEARQLTWVRGAFEDMDRNHDGILTRFEYEDAVR